jgi:GDP-4-dehydro-6-deoxy-D-mannose reductase
VRVLVTGAGGFAGQHLMRALLGRGREVVGTTLDGESVTGGTLLPEEVTRIEWVGLDVTAPSSLDAVLAGEAFGEVYHLAGQRSVGQSFTDPVATWEVNATGTLQLLQALARRSGARCRVLVISSAEVYGAVPESDQPVEEARAPSPITPYGASKLGAEAVAMQAAASGGLEVVIARSFNHAGPGQDARFIFPSMARQLADLRGSGAERVLRVGNLEARRDFLDVRDVAEAYLRLMERGVSGGLYNVCSGVSHSLRSLVETLVRISGTGARIGLDPARFRPADIPELRGSPERLRALGWAPTFTVEEMLRDLYREAVRSSGETARAEG